METKTEKSTKQLDQERSAAIMLAVEVKSTFELYAYRIISPEQYFERIKELTAVFNYSISKKKKHSDMEKIADEVGEIDPQYDLIDSILEKENKK